MYKKPLHPGERSGARYRIATPMRLRVPYAAIPGNAVVLPKEIESAEGTPITGATSSAGTLSAGFGAVPL